MKRKVLLIGLDGTRPDSLLVAKTPNMDRLVSRGAFSWHAQTEIQGISGPCWTSLLTGVHTEQHGVYNNEFTFRDFQYKSISALLIDWDQSMRCIAHTNWEPIITNIFEEGTLSNSSTGTDKEVTDKMIHDIKKGKGDFHFIGLDDVDFAGHNHTYSPISTKYLEAIEKSDMKIGYLLDAIETRPSSEDWLVCLISDHGGSGKHHGERGISEDYMIPFILEGIGVIQGEIRLEDNVEIFDVLPTIAKFLDMPPNEYWVGTIRGLT
jgi:predicted AlkP superfamily pyrophosphatase or phosphodiesterase